MIGLGRTEVGGVFVLGSMVIGGPFSSCCCIKDVSKCGDFSDLVMEPMEITLDLSPIPCRAATSCTWPAIEDMNNKLL